MARLFGTDGVRGVFETELTTDLAYNLGKYGSYVLSQGNHNPKIVIGMDTRISGKPLEDALVKGITEMGGDVLLAGVVPTPAIAVLVRELKADAGIVISASHNPYKFNGIKFFNNEGFKLPDRLEDEIEACLTTNQPIDCVKLGSVTTLDNAANLYLEHIRKEISPNLTGKKIVLDCANGASALIATDFFRSFGADVFSIGCEPDGKNINAGCGSTHLEPLCQAVVNQHADFGFAFDGDADRCLAVDNKGRIIDGDSILNLIGRKMKLDGTLKKDTIVVTVMSNIGLDIALNEAGCRSIKTQVGDRYVLEEMRENGYNIGGEQSGHVILLDYNTTGDGILTALNLASIFASDQRSSSELNDLMTAYPQVLVNATVSNEKKHDYLKDEVIQKEIEKVEAHFNGNGRVLIRPSGTEPLVRVMIEGQDQSELEQIAGDLAQLIKSRLG